MSNVLRFQPQSTNQEIGTSPKKVRYNGNGGGNMNEYVTREEFNNAMHQIDRKFDQVDHRLDLIDQKFGQKFDQIPVMIENALFKEREYQRSQQKENRRFFWGTIIIGGISAVAARYCTLSS